MDQAAGAERLPGVERLLQGVQHEVGTGGTGHLQPTTYRANTSTTNVT